MGPHQEGLAKVGVGGRERFDQWTTEVSLLHLRGSGLLSELRNRIADRRKQPTGTRNTPRFLVLPDHAGAATTSIRCASHAGLLPTKRICDRVSSVARTSASRRSAAGLKPEAPRIRRSRKRGRGPRDSWVKSSSPTGIGSVARNLTAMSLTGAAVWSRPPGSRHCRAARPSRPL